MSRSHKATAKPAPTNPFACIADDAQCNLGRCPACELHRLRARSESDLRELQKLRRERDALTWALLQIERCEHLTDERVLNFARAVLDTLDANPEHLRLLRGDK
jgi:hypothetical protein